MRMGLVLLTCLLLYGCAEVPAPKPALAILDTGLTQGASGTSEPAGCDMRPRRDLVLFLRSRLKTGTQEAPLLRFVKRYDSALADCNRRFSSTVRIIYRRDAQIGGAK